MLLGDCFYYSASDGIARPYFDNLVTAGYAQSVSKRFPDDVVVWKCKNGDSKDVREFRNGLLVDWGD